MSDKEIQRLAVLQDVRDHRITQVRAAEILNLSTRQITRLLQKLNQAGISGLAHASRGQPGHRRHDEAVKSECLSIISEHLLGFGPTLAHEKLSSMFALNIPVETVRRWMTANDLWIPRSKRLKRPYQPRYNRDCFGELIQMDGSYHDWFEGRAAKCCLLVYIDDATGKLLHLRFCEAETTFDYMLSTRTYIEQYGKPLAFYSDKHSVFRVNQKSKQDSQITQFGRVLSTLNIDIIFANSPQAKGRVERANRTLQDRLIKEMRLEGICSIAEANIWLPCFIEQFNQKFAKCARNPKNLHRPLTEAKTELDDIFTWQEPRKVTKSLTITYDKCIYLLEPTELNQKLVGQYISFLEYPDGTVAIEHQGRKINYSIFNKLAGLQQNEVVENKRLGSVLAHIQQQHEELEQQNKRSRSKKSMPRQQLNERTALCLLCLLDMTPEKLWNQASNPLVGITPIMSWSREHYQREYAPNTRETFRRQSMHQFIEAGICLYNPDKPDRPVNSPKAVYQIESNLLQVLQTYGTEQYAIMLQNYLQQRQTLAQMYAREREMNMIPLQLTDGQTILLSAGDHSQLIKDIVTDFGARYVPGGALVYAGDTGNKHGFFDVDLLASLGVQLDNHGKLPDVVIYNPEKNWLFLIEAVTSHGPVDHKRYGELNTLFQSCTAGLVFVSAFPDTKTYVKYSGVIAWETEVWMADNPSHMIHFNGSRFMGPY